MEQEVVLAGPAGHGHLPQNGYTHHLGSTMRFLSPGDSARVNINPFIYRSIRGFLAEQRPFDVVHLHEPYIPFIGPAFLHMSDSVKVGTFHTWRDGVHMPYLLGWPLLNYWNRKLDGRIAVSEFARKTIQRYVPGEYEIIPNGVDFQRFAKPAPPPSHLADSRPTLLFVGRIESRKGIPWLLDAYKIVKEAIPNARLVIVGEGGLVQEYKDTTRRLELMDVYFEGYVAPEKLAGYYQRADVFCSPSTVNESFGITLLEAMAAGTPVVATTTNGPSTLGPDGVNGLIVPPRDAKALAEATITLLEDRPLAQKFADNAHERAREFDWERVALRLIAYYEKLGA